MRSKALVNKHAATLSIALATTIATVAWAQQDAPVQAPYPASPPQSTVPAPATSMPEADVVDPAHADTAREQPAQTATQAPVPDVPPVPEAAPQPDPVESEFDALDDDGDGKVSASEHAAGAKARFDAMDADHNYHISAQEAARDAGGASIAQQIQGADRIDPVDSNNNGEVSNEESRVDAEAAFRARDANRDGSLSLEEMRGDDAQPKPSGSEPEGEN